MVEVSKDRFGRNPLKIRLTHLYSLDRNRDRGWNKQPLKLASNSLFPHELSISLNDGRVNVQSLGCYYFFPIYSTSQICLKLSGLLIITIN